MALTNTWQGQYKGFKITTGCDGGRYVLQWTRGAQQSGEYSGATKEELLTAWYGSPLGRGSEDAGIIVNDCP